MVDNLFMNEYLPYAEENYSKVYLYGLYLCTNPSGRDNSMESLLKVLDMDEDTVLNIFRHWQDEGLLEIVSVSPLEVRYLSIKGQRQPPKKYSSGKYADFNSEAQKLFSSRMIVPNEYLQYYETMESCKIQPDAMLMIIQYCITHKGVSVRYPYVTAVARDWARDGVHTVKDVEEKLNEYEVLDEDMRAVMKALGRKGSADLDEKQAYTKWTRSWGFDLPAILFAAKKCRNRGGFKKLDAKLDEFYRMNIFDEKEMAEFVRQRDAMYDLAYRINRQIGLYYDVVDSVVETYVAPWLGMGFDEDALLDVAKYCFTSNIKTLSGMQTVVARFHKLGLITSGSIKEYIERQIQNDSVIREILSTLGLSRNVSREDRENYRSWCVDWGMPDELIRYAAELAASGRFPMQTMNRQLAAWRDARVTTLAEARKQAAPVTHPLKTSSKNFAEREYSKEELDGIFSDIHDFDNMDI